MRKSNPPDTPAHASEMVLTTRLPDGRTLIMKLLPDEPTAVKAGRIRPSRVAGNLPLMLPPEMSEVRDGSYTGRTASPNFPEYLSEQLRPAVAKRPAPAALFRKAVPEPHEVRAPQQMVRQAASRPSTPFSPAVSSMVNRMISEGDGALFRARGESNGNSTKTPIDTRLLPLRLRSLYHPELVTTIEAIKPVPMGRPPGIPFREPGAGEMLASSMQPGLMTGGIADTNISSLLAPARPAVELFPGTTLPLFRPASGGSGQRRAVRGAGGTASGSLFVSPETVGRMQTVDPQSAYGEALRQATVPPAVPTRQARKMADALGMGLSFREPISRVPQIGRREQAERQPPPSLWGALTDLATWKTVLNDFQRIQKQNAERDPLHALYLDRTGRHKEAAAVLAAMESTPRGALERGFQENLGASGGSIAGAGTGLGLAARMRLKNPYVVGAMALGGGLLGARGVADLQRTGRQALFSPEANAAYEALMARDQAQQPVASLVGELVASMPFNGPSVGAAKVPGLFRRAAGGAALGAGMEAGTQGFQIATGERERWDPLRIAGQGAGGAIPTRQTALGAGAHRVGDWAGQSMWEAGAQAGMSQTLGVGLGGAQGKPDNPSGPTSVQSKSAYQTHQAYPSQHIIHGELHTFNLGDYQKQFMMAQDALSRVALRQYAGSKVAPSVAVKEKIEGKVNAALSRAVFNDERFHDIIRRHTPGGSVRLKKAAPGYGYFDDPDPTIGLQFNHNYSLVVNGDAPAIYDVADAIGRATAQEGMLVVQLQRGQEPLPRDAKETTSVIFYLPKDISLQQYQDLSKALSSHPALTVPLLSGGNEPLFGGNTFFQRSDGNLAFYTNSYYSSLSAAEFDTAIFSRREIIRGIFDEIGVPFKIDQSTSAAYAYKMNEPRQGVDTGGPLNQELQNHISQTLQKAINSPAQFLKRYGLQTNVSQTKGQTGKSTPSVSPPTSRPSRKKKRR